MGSYERTMFWSLLALSAAALAFGTHHARAMLQFVPTGERTPDPESLSGWRVARVLLTGVRIPRPEHSQTPAVLGRVFESVQIPVSEGVRLGAWVVPPRRAPGPQRVAILFHGYAAAADQLLPVAECFLAAGYRVVLVDFRGSGSSSGCSTGLGTTEAIDVAAAVRWAVHLGDPAPILYGFSLGAAALIRALAHEPLPCGLAIAEASFGRLTTTVGARFRALGLPPLFLDSFLVLCGSIALRTNGFAVAPESDATRITAPLLVLNGDRDARVSLAEARRIASAPTAELEVVPGLDHRPLAALDPAAFDALLGRVSNCVIPVNFPRARAKSMRHLRVEVAT